MKQKLRYYSFFLGSVLCAFIFLVMLFSRKPVGFSLDKIRSPFEPSSKWEIDHLPAFEKEEIRKILSLDFTYLGSGAQCYAFLSADGKYVLKFFKMKHLIPKKWLKLIPFPGLDQYRFSKIDTRILRHQELFASCKMAYEELKEETGLLFIHLNKSKNLKLRVKLYDRMGNCYVANLDDYEFVVQKKAEMIRTRITTLMEEGKREEAIENIHLLFAQVVDQCKKGYIDRDSGISHNYGFVDSQVIHFDTGRIVKDEQAKQPSYYQREVLRVGEKLESWLSIHYPILLPDVEEVINALIALPSQSESPSQK